MISRRINPFLAFSLGLLATTPVNAQQPASTRRLTVQANGTSKSSPDVAFITLGVTTESPRASEASQANATRSQKVMDSVKKLGIAAKDIQTTSYFVQPVYRQNDPTQIRGYTVSNLISCTVRRIPDLGKVIDAALEAGANNFQGVSFGLDDRGDAEAAAMTDAVHSARRKADAMAKAVGLTLGEILDMHGDLQENRPVPLAFGGEAMMARSAVSTPISPGELTTSATVTIVYSLQPRGAKAPVPPKQIAGTKP